MALVGGHRQVEFTATDANRGLLDAYRETALGWAGETGFRVVAAADGWRFARGDRAVRVRFRQVSVPDGLVDEESGSFDLLLAQAFWDLVPPGTALPLARRLLARGGVFYAALTFSGETRFKPPHSLDRRVLAAYHASMEGDRGGDSRAGERLIGEFGAPESGFRELASGRSDWRVEPEAGGYPADEAFFLETVLGFFEKELRASAAVTAAGRDDWLAARRRQLAAGRLVYTARQFDLAAQRGR